MALNFAKLQARVNSAVMRVLSDCEALLDGQPVSGMLTPGFADPVFDPVGPAGSSPEFVLAVTSVPASVAGKVLEITSGPAQGTSYRVTHHQPDGTGLATLFLHKS